MLHPLSAMTLEVDLAGTWRECEKVEIIRFNFCHLLLANVDSHQRARMRAALRHQVISIERHERLRVFSLDNQLRLLAGRAQPKPISISPFAGADEIPSRPDLPKTAFKARPAFSHFFRHIFLSVENWAGVGLIGNVAEFAIDD